MSQQKILTIGTIVSIIVVGLFMLNIYMENLELKDKLIGVLDEQREISLEAIDKLNDARVRLEQEVHEMDAQVTHTTRLLNNEITRLNSENRKLHLAVNRAETARVDEVSEIEDLPPDELGNRAGEALKGLYGGSPVFVMELPDEFRANEDAVKLSLQAAIDVKYGNQKLDFLNQEIDNLNLVVAKEKDISKTLAEFNEKLKESDAAKGRELDAWGDYRTAAENEIEVLKKHSKRDKILWLVIGVAGGAVLGAAY